MTFAPIMSTTHGGSTAQGTGTHPPTLKPIMWYAISPSNDWPLLTKGPMTGLHIRITMQALRDWYPTCYEDHRLLYHFGKHVIAQSYFFCFIPLTSTPKQTPTHFKPVIWELGVKRSMRRIFVKQLAKVWPQWPPLTTWTLMFYNK